MKRVVDGQVAATVSREGLWHALTPQMFRLGALRAALQAARAAGVSVTDEAQAMELAGHVVGVVPGRADNVKITRREDLELAAWLIQRLDRQA
jgi:2-C-methyl-D-erythritol 4-phosphate cytidylyltransferase